jgi:glycerophosphoryl diester phosphodiesterase
MLPITVPAGFHTIAHRGASAYAPENTAAAFALAARMGVIEVELDTQLTRDGQIALVHDATLARYGHGPRVVEDLTWAELAALDMGAWFSPFLFAGEAMITLDDLFATYGDRLIYHVEIKGRAAGLPAAVYNTIQQHRLTGRCVITSFSYDALVATRALTDELPLGWLVRRIDAETLVKAKAIGLAQLCPNAAQVSAAQVALARQAVREVRAWGLNGDSTHTQSADVIALIGQVVEAGCDGMTLNWPDWVRPAV